jgi:hypothetical protein
MIAHYYTRQGDPAKWTMPIMPIPDYSEIEEENAEYIKRAKKLLDSGMPIHKVADNLSTSTSTLKSRLDKCGIEYKLKRRVDNTGLQYSLKFEEVDDFKTWLNANGIKTGVSSKPQNLFNVRLPHTKAVRVVVNAMGIKQIVMPFGLIQHYKQWKRIQ